MASMFVRVVDGEVESVGPLPAVANRLDTGHRVDPRTRLKACGYYDVDTFTAADLPAGTTPQQAETITATVDATRTRHDRKTVFVNELRPALFESARNYDWGWLQRYSYFQFDGLEPGAGGEWPTNVTQQIMFLRRGLSWALYEQVQLIDFADLAGRLLRELLDATDLEPPAPPEPPVMALLPVELSEEA